MAYYNEVMRNDIITMCRGLLENRAMFLRDVDGKLKIDGKTGWQTPWVHVKQGNRANCTLWNTVMFQNIFNAVPFSMKKGRAWVPSGCQSCWKVVVRPPTLKALFALEALQKRLDRECKCGIEQRKHVFGLYGGYFYNRSYEEGMARYQEVRQAVDDDPELGPDVSVILKRGCTEMEHAVGPSNEWQVYPEQIEIEKLVHRTVSTDHEIRRQPPHGKNYVHGRWIRFAYQWGDETVKEYIDTAMPLYPPYVTYHDKEVKGDDENSIS